MAAITVLVDDRSGPGLRPEHGLAMWIEAAGKRILFDTGQGGALIANAHTLGIDLSIADAIVLSHGHYDHTGGLAAVLSLAWRAIVYLHPSALEAKYSVRQGSARSIGMPEESRAALSKLTKKRCIFVREPSEIAPGIGLSGPIPRMSGFEGVGDPFYLMPDAAKPDTMEDDLAMWLGTPKGLAVITGCAHAGLVNTLDYVNKIAERKSVSAVIGGFHLGGAGEGRLVGTAEALKALFPDMVIPCHCSGEKAVFYLGKSLGSIVKPGRAGDHYRLMDD